MNAYALISELSGQLVKGEGNLCSEVFNSVCVGGCGWVWGGEGEGAGWCGGMGIVDSSAFSVYPINFYRMLQL